MATTGSHLSACPAEIRFSHLTGELEEWYKTTLSGANLPFSLRDPRRCRRGNHAFNQMLLTNTIDTKTVTEQWRRKSLLPRKVTGEDFQNSELYTVISSPMLWVSES